MEVTDKTDGLVTYEIADGWTKLEGYDGVYYREVAADAADNVFSVLKGDKVTYSAELENSNMLDANGNLKTGIELTFKASAIQQAGFENAVDAYCKIPVSVSSAKELVAAINSNASVISLSDDVDIETNILNIEKAVTLDLNGHTLSSSTTRMIYVKSGGELLLKGDANSSIIKCTERREGASKTGSEAPLYITGGSVTLEGVTIMGGTTETNDAAIIVSATQEVAKLEIKSGTIDANGSPYAIRVGRVNDTKYGVVTRVNWDEATIIGKIAGDGAFVGIDDTHKSLLNTDTPVNAVINDTTYYFYSEKSKKCTMNYLGLE